MAREPRVLLVRHAETEWSLSGRHTGSTDIPITEEGRRSLSHLRRHLVDQDFERVLVSPLKRARQTCNELDLGPRPEVRSELAEWRYGEYEGLTHEEIHERDAEWELWRDGAPGGESPSDVAARIDRLVEELQTAPPHGDVLLIAHGHSLRAFGARWIEQPLATGRHLRLSTATVSALGWRRGTPVMWQWNTAI